MPEQCLRLLATAETLTQAIHKRRSHPSPKYCNRATQRTSCGVPLDCFPPSIPSKNWHASCNCSLNVLEGCMERGFWVMVMLGVLILA